MCAVHRFKGLVAAAVLLAMGATSAQANILLRDNFLYEEPNWYDLGELAGQYTEAGMGWDNTENFGKWVISNSDAVSTPSVANVISTTLTRPQLAVDGGAVEFTAGDEGALNTFVQIGRSTDDIGREAGQPMYFSMLINRTVGDNDDGGRVGVNFTRWTDTSNTSNETGPLSFGIKDSGYFIGAHDGSSTVIQDVAQGTYANGNTSLLVMKVNINESGNDTIDLFINPDPLAGEPGTSDYTLSNVEVWGSNTVLAGVFARFGGDTGSITGDSFLFDEIRIASAWNNAVVGVPEPATMSVLGLGGLMMLSRRRR